MQMRHRADDEAEFVREAQPTGKRIALDGLIPEKHPRSRSTPAQNLLPAVFFALCIPFQELLLRLADPTTRVFGLAMARALFAGMAAGVGLWLISVLIPGKKLARGVTGVLLFLIAAVFIIERCCKAFFGTYFQLGFMTDMTGQVAGDFMSTVVSVAWKNLWFFPLALMPAVVFLIFRRRLVPDYPDGRVVRPLALLGALVVLQIVAVLLCHGGDDSSYYTVDFTANSAVPRFGLVNTLRLEAQYALFGAPELTLTLEPEIITTTESAVGEEEDVLPEEGETGDTAAEVPEEEIPEAEETEEELEEEIVYEANILDIDFDALIASDTSSVLLTMDQYFSAQEATLQNEYTGLFEGKNLIFITAEAFSGAIIDETLTPALYFLSTSGFVFTDYYQPGWGQSTTGGEFAAMTGLIPTWVNSKTSYYASVNNAMPFSLGWQLQALGYTCTAWHNNSYTYYHRNLTHVNMGYDFYGIGNGLVLDSSASWPASDLELFQATIGEQIAAYVEDGTLFHTYYMTVSGHCNYSFTVNAMSQKNRSAVADLDCSDTVKAYIACQLELEYALEYLLEELETAGILEDTVIVLTADHYPYALAEGDTDYYNELTGNNDSENDTSRYQNTLILWCGSMEEPVVVDTPCSAIDILPTLSNLFGLEYDSRLLSGRDILAEDTPAGEVSTAMHIVVFPDQGYGYSWITAAGTYEAYTGVFTANEGVTVSDDYVSSVSAIVQNRFTYAKYIIAQDYYSHVLSGGD